MKSESNQQKLLDIEVPIYQMEQKIELLEIEVQRMNTGVSEQAITAICERINDQTMQYLPKIAKKFNDLKKHLDEMQKHMLRGMESQ